MGIKSSDLSERVLKAMRESEAVRPARRRLNPPPQTSAKFKSITLRLPLPPKQLSPNGRFHYMAKAKAVKEYRLNAATAAILAVRHLGCEPPRLETATCQAIFTFKDNRRRDRDNLLASLKAAFDGLRDGGLIADDSGLRHEPVAIRIGTDPHVALIVTKLESSAQVQSGG